MSGFEERMQRWQEAINAEQQRLNEAIASHYAANGYSDAEARQAAAALRDTSTALSNAYSQMAATPSPAERMRLRNELNAWHESQR